MKKTIIRLLALVLVVVMAMTAFVACAKEETEETKDSVSTELTAADILGFDKQDNGGKNFVVFVNDR